MKSKIKKTCIFCHKKFEVFPCLNHIKCCSISCSRKYLWKQPKFRQNMINKSKGKHHSPKTEFKKGNHYSIKTEFKKGRHSSKRTEFTSRKLKKIWSNSKYKEKTLKASMLGRQIEPNKPEKILRELLQKILPNKYKYNKTTIIAGLMPDFINRNNNKIIELYGDYWHKLKVTLKRDKRRVKTYSKYRYKTLIIWQHELKNLELVIAKIMEFEL